MPEATAVAIVVAVAVDAVQERPCDQRRSVALPVQHVRGTYTHAHTRTHTHSHILLGSGYTSGEKDRFATWEIAKTVERRKLATIICRVGYDFSSLNIGRKNVMSFFPTVSPYM